MTNSGIPSPVMSANSGDSLQMLCQISCSSHLSLGLPGFLYQ